MRILFPHPSWLYRFGIWYPMQACVWGWRSSHRHPKLWALLLVAAGLSVMLGSDAGYFALAPALLPVWRVAHPVSFRHWVIRPLRADWRRHRLYGRKWHYMMTLTGLGQVIDDGVDALPEILKVRTHGYSATWDWTWPPRRTVTCRDAVVVRPVVGHHPDDYRDAAERLAFAVGARACRVHDEPRNRLRLEFHHGVDPLEAELEALPIPESSAEIDLRRVPVGLTETGKPWTIDVLLHLLLAGQTGSGKSGVLQGLLRGLAPMIRDGLVVVHAIDPKEGLEFGPAREMFARFTDGTLQDFAALLGDAVTLCHDRGRRMAAQGLRKHVPTVDEPLVLVVIDELVDLTDLKGMPPGDKPTGALIAGSLNHLLRKGRAKGVIVIGALTDARVDVLPMRRHFVHRIGMRLETKQETTMILGAGARERGAFCEDIPTSLPGVGFAMMDGDREAVRVRAAKVTDEDIEAMVAEYAPKVREPAAN